MRKDPDPFDERHPYRTDPSCQFGFLLKQLFRKDIFMKKVSGAFEQYNPISLIPIHFACSWSTITFVTIILHDKTYKKVHMN